MPNVNKEELLQRITIDPKIMVGKPVIRGMRITVEQILGALAGGVSEKDLLEDYPVLESDDIKAVLLYANELVKEERVYSVNLGEK
ncbi:MAG: hypothetical protein JWR72_4219 [Flavisolibacter sp.]|jgi:uncharacterized protein (DUF433 family)|nr:hypothetical protein [Flavisolibacter sp.]